MTVFPVQHLSPSSINMFGRCGRQFMYRYLEGLIIPPGISAIRGTGAHHGVEANLRSIADDGSPAPIEAVAYACRDKINAEWERGVRLLPDEQGQPESTLRGVAVDEAIRLSRTHYDSIAPNLRPVQIDTIYDRMDPDRWIIVIDDLGRERNSGTMPQYVADIIAAIYERRTRAIITTNLSSRQVGDRYGSEIRSRLLDSAWITPIRCTGDDLRIRRNDTGGSNDTE